MCVYIYIYIYMYIYIYVYIYIYMYVYMYRVLKLAYSISTMVYRVLDNGMKKTAMTMTNSDMSRLYLMQQFSEKWTLKSCKV